MIEHRLFVPIAQSIPIGTATKVVHKGCPRTKRPALYVSNEADAYWCYCHGCGETGHYQKTHQRIKVKPPKKTGWVPDDLIYFGDVDVNRLPSIRFLGNDWVAHNASLLKLSYKTMRLYLPDYSESYLGMDITGAANARWYSPKYRKLAMVLNKVGKLYVTAFVHEYLEAVRKGYSAMLCMDKNAERYALAELSKLNLDEFILQINPKFLSKDFILNLRAIGG